MEYLFQSPQSPTNSPAGLRKRRGSSDIWPASTAVLEFPNFPSSSLEKVSPVSSPRRNSSQSSRNAGHLHVRTSFDGLHGSDVESSPSRSRHDQALLREEERTIPGWATPPKLRQSKSPLTSPKGSKSPSRRTSGGGGTYQISSQGGVFSSFAGDRDGEIYGSTNASGSLNGSGCASLNNSFDASVSNNNNSSSSSSSSSSVFAAAMPDRFIPNREGVDIDLAGHALSKLSDCDENAVAQLGEGYQSNKPSNKTNSTANRTHLGVISNANNVMSSPRLLSCFQSRLGPTSSSSERESGRFNSPRDDGFSRLKEEKANSEVTVPVTGAAAAALTGTNGSLSIGLVGSSSSSSSSSPSGRSSSRFIPSQSSRILDAPDLMDDYYLNLLSWGSSNTIAVALNQSVYLWHASDGHIDTLMTLEGDDYVTSVQWAGEGGGNTLAVGTSTNTVEIWDASALTKVREMTGHTSRVSSLAWNESLNTHLLSSGGRDSTIVNHDIRAARNVQSVLQGHTQEICGLSWSPDGSTLASGGNENRLCIWDVAMSTRRNAPTTGSSQNASSSSAPRFIIEQHTAAVKAVSWCPWQRNVLASGGGTADRTIRIWNTASGLNLRTMDTGSQVCAIQWSLTEKELVSSHGFSDNQIILWKYGQRSSSLTKLREFHGHTSRILHLARSPDGATICSASADETLRFWDIFGPKRGAAGGGAGSAGAAASPLKTGAGAGLLGGLGAGGLLFNANSSSSNSPHSSMLHVR